MDINSYQEKAMSFRLPSADESYAMFNLSGEVGELHSLIAKAIRDGKQIDYEINLRKELGDILWCLAAVAADEGFSLAEVAEHNIMKLEGRKANGTINGSGDNR